MLDMYDMIFKNLVRCATIKFFEYVNGRIKTHILVLRCVSTKFNWAVTGLLKKQKQVIC